MVLLVLWVGGEESAVVDFTVLLGGFLFCFVSKPSLARCVGRSF